MIPKIIHYCWYGRGPKPAVFEQCLESWKKYMPDYEIIEWNEDNTDLNWCSFLKNAYEQKKWAFVSDVVRCLVVYEHGGIYMDTDVEITGEEFSSYFQTDGAVFFFESNVNIATGLGFGAEAGNLLLYAILQDYKQSDFDPKRLNDMSCPQKNTAVIKSVIPSFRANGVTQTINECKFLCADDYYRTAHHYGELSWLDAEHKQLQKYIRRMRVPQSVRTKLSDAKIFEFFDKYKLKPIKKIYTFMVYDFIDYGPKYCFARVLQKIKGKFKKSN